MGDAGDQQQKLEKKHKKHHKKILDEGNDEPNEKEKDKVIEQLDIIMIIKNQMNLKNPKRLRMLQIKI